MARTTDWRLCLVIMVTLVGSSVRAIDKNIIGTQREVNFFNGYVKTKMLMHCFGKPAVEYWQHNYQKMWYECEREVRPFKPNITKATEAYPFKAKPFFAFRRTRHVKYHTDINIQVLQCVFNREKQVVGKNGIVTTQRLKANIRSEAKMDSRLRHYVLSGINDCALRTGCEDYSDFGEGYKDFIKQLEFHRCQLRSRLQACIKWDLKKTRNNFVLLGLGKTLNGLYHNSKRFAVSLFFANANLKGPFEFDI